MTVSAAFDVAGRRRSLATTPGYHAGRAPRNTGQLYPADPEGFQNACSRCSSVVFVDEPAEAVAALDLVTGRSSGCGCRSGGRSASPRWGRSLL
jgi:hypothetical protein